MLRIFDLNSLPEYLYYKLRIPKVLIAGHL
jgi:hypothetical protein